MSPRPHAPPPPGAAAAAPSSSRWHGQLALRFEAGAVGARLVHNRHAGPLRLLKALASEDGRRLEAVIVHPPGGLVGGDSLELAVALGADARVLATTPGAQKWYRGETTAGTCTRIALSAGAFLEWLPQPAILFDQARARQSLAIELDPAAACVGWEVLVRGRKAMGERIAGGHIDQTLAISVGRRPLWQERLHADATDRIFDSPLGWGGRRIAASVWCCAPGLAADRLRDLRDRWRWLLDPSPVDAPTPASDASGIRGGATVVTGGLLLAKILADDGERLMSLCQALWRSARLAVEGDEGSVPRIWRT